MHEHPDADGTTGGDTDAAGDADDAAVSDADTGVGDLVVVAVVRSGGIAGLRRRWRVERAASDAERWIMLIDRCPWDAPAAAESGADRYVWTVIARTPAEERERELGESELDGPWRELVDAVRAAEDSDDGRGGGRSISTGV